MMYEFVPRGVCARKIILDVQEGVVCNVEFIGGCNGNLKGISALVKGMKTEDVIEKLSGIKCGMKNTSCPAQLAEALRQV